MSNYIHVVIPMIEQGDIVSIITPVDHDGIWYTYNGLVYSVGTNHVNIRDVVVNKYQIGRDIVSYKHPFWEFDSHNDPYVSYFRKLED